MGDDIDAPHSYSFKVSADATLNDIFNHLAKKRYLASVAGKNHSWEAVIENQPVAMVRGNNQQPEPSELLANKISQYVKNGGIDVHFKYNSSTT